jgi:hypothetical protein
MVILGSELCAAVRAPGTALAASAAPAGIAVDSAAAATAAPAAIDAMCFNVPLLQLCDWM